MKYRPDIDGLRAVAIVAVVLGHINANLAPGGFIGVDVFFVISGFLISQILLSSIHDGSFSYLSFYRKRIRRLFPALFFMLSLVSIAALVLLTPTALVEFGKTLIATALFVSNVEFYELTNYFDDGAGIKLLIHTWTLAVEEQFYLFFPFVLTATNRWFRGRYLEVFLVCAIISFLLSMWLTVRSPGAAFYFGPSRAFELMTGAILALDVLPQLSRRISREVVSATGMCTIVYCVLAFDETTRFPGPFALLPCLGAAALIYAGQSGKSAASATLSLSPIRFIGTISYSLYLWHWPMLSLARNYYIGQETTFQLFCAVAIATVMSIISWRFIEQPFRLPSQRDRPIFAKAAAVTAGAILVGALIIWSGGFPERFSAASLRMFGFENNYNRLREKCHSTPNDVISYADSCRYGAVGEQNLVAIWGDSFASELSAALGETVRPRRAIIEISSSSCPPVLDYDEQRNCAAHNWDVYNNLLRDKRVHSVVLIARYHGYFKHWAEFRPGFERAVAGLVSGGKQVIIVYPLPEFSYPVPMALGTLVARGVAPETYRESVSEYRNENGIVVAELDGLTSKYGLSRVIGEEVLCTRQYCQGYDGHDALFFDAVHLSISGARKLVPAINALLGDAHHTQAPIEIR